MSVEALSREGHTDESPGLAGHHIHRIGGHALRREGEVLIGAEPDLRVRDDGVAVVSGDLTIRRTAFGIGGGEWNDDDLVSDEVTIRFRLAFAPPRTGGTP